jgi:hypothetical protein
MQRNAASDQSRYPHSIQETLVDMVGHGATTASTESTLRGKGISPLLYRREAGGEASFSDLLIHLIF